MSNSNSISSELLDKLSHLAECSINQSPDEFLQMLPGKICEYLGVATCIIWIKDAQTDTYKILATDENVDHEYKATELNVSHPGVQFRSSQQIFYLQDISRENHRLADKKQLVAMGYKSLLSSPLKIQQDVIGILDVYTKDIRNFKSWEKKLFLSIAQQITISLQKKQFTQILESFVNVAVQAIERRNLGWLDRITHEFRSPLIGTRANASFLQRRFRFKDWGIGISEENREKIFNEGFREPAAMRKNVSGSELGLFISRSIAREMKGNLELVNLFHPTEFLLTVYNHGFYLSITYETINCFC